MRGTAALLVLAPLACSQPPTQGTAPDAPQLAETWSSCYRGFRPNGIPRSDLERLTHACGKLGGMRPLTPIVVQYQRAGDPSHRYALDVPPGGGCYRVYAAGDHNVADLDLVVADIRGPLTGDVTHDTWPVLPPQGPLCLDTPGRYRLEVSVTDGAGYYALQLWGTSTIEASSTSREATVPVAAPRFSGPRSTTLRP